LYHALIPGWYCGYCCAMIATSCLSSLRSMNACGCARSGRDARPWVSSGRTVGRAGGGGPPRVRPNRIASSGGPLMNEGVDRSPPWRTTTLPYNVRYISGMYGNVWGPPTRVGRPERRGTGLAPGGVPLATILASSPHRSNCLSLVVTYKKLPITPTMSALLARARTPTGLAGAPRRPARLPAVSVSAVASADVKVSRGGTAEQRPAQGGAPCARAALPRAACALPPPPLPL
jgi:hypothetical protein